MKMNEILSEFDQGKLLHYDGRYYYVDKNTGRLKEYIQSNQLRQPDATFSFNKLLEICKPELFIDSSGLVKEFIVLKKEKNSNEYKCLGYIDARDINNLHDESVTHENFRLCVPQETGRLVKKQ